MIQRRSPYARALPLLGLSAVLTACDSTTVLIGSVDGAVSIEGAPVAGVEVRLVGHSTAALVTGSEGRFRFENVAGSYRLELGDLPPDAVFERTSATLDIAAGRTSTTDFRGRWIRTSAISGVVRVGTEGIAGVLVSASGPSSAQTRTDEAGAFALTGLRAGSYLLALSDYDAERFEFAEVAVAVVPGVDQQVTAAFEAELRPPYAPSSLSAVNDGPYGVTVTWQDRSAHEADIRVERRRGAEAWAEIAVLGPNEAAYADEGLAPGTWYAYRVRACNEIGCSEYSDEATDRTEQVPPPQPTAVAGEPLGAFRVLVRWEDESANETGFHIERRDTASGDWHGAGAVDPDVTQFSDEGLSPRTTYAHRIRACNEAGCSAWASGAPVTTPDVPPDPPANPTAADEGPDRIRLAWADMSANEDRFEVNRRPSQGDVWVVLPPLDADATELLDMGLQPGTSYDYRVRSCNDVGCSAFSAVVAARTRQIPPSPPTDLIGTALDAYTIVLGWTDQSPNELAFHLERSADAGTSWVEVAVTDPDVQTWTDSPLTPDTEYSYRIKACNEVGCSAVEASGEVGTPPIPPSAPSSLVAQASGSDRVDLTWTDGSDNEDDFRIERRFGPGPWSELVALAAGSTAYADTGLLPGTSYSYRARACNGGGCSSYTAEAVAQTEQAPPPAPTALTATSVSSDRIDLAWLYSGANEDGLHVERRSAGGAWAEIAIHAPGSLTHSDTGLTTGVTYDYRVRACNVVGCSAFSPVASATTVVGPQDNLVVSGVHITQAVQTTGGSVPLVRNVGGLLRVFVTTGVANVHQPDVRVRLYHNGALVQTSTIPAPAGSVPLSVVEGSLASSWNLGVSGSLIQPGLEILVDVDPGNLVAEADEGDNIFPAGGVPAALDVRDPAPFPVVFVPVRQSVNGLEGVVGDPASFFSMASRVFPINNMGGSVRSTYITDAPALEANNSNNAWGTILSEISALRAADGSSAAYYGVVKVGYGGGVAGIGFVGATVAVGWDKSSRAGIAAHEWGHNFGRRHAPCGGAGGPDPNFPYPSGRIGVWGYDRVAGTLVDPTVTYDLMGYCGPDWISDYTYVGILGSRGNASPPAAPPEASAGLLIWGRIDASGAVLEPAFDVTAPASLPRRAGPYRIRGLDAAGGLLFAMDFDGDELPAEVGGGRQFAFVVPLDRFDRTALHSLHLDGPGMGVARARPSLAPGTLAAEPTARRAPDGAVELRWDAASHPMALVRDARTGRILSFARGGGIRLQDAPVELDISLSDNVASIRRRVRVR